VVTDKSGTSDVGRPQIEVGLVTDLGRVREINEDSAYFEPPATPEAERMGVFCAVADGMGGHEAGEIASGLAVRTARDVFYRSDGMPIPNALVNAIEIANHEVYVAGVNGPANRRMGSTMTAVVVRELRAFVAHVGDSRCYLVASGQISQVTQDHSWVADQVARGFLTPEEAKIHPHRNVITRALGLREDVEVAAYQADLNAGAILVLCSDGLHGVVSDEEIRLCVSSLAPPEAATRLVALANERGGPDNVTALVIRMHPPGDHLDTQRTEVSNDDTTPTSIQVPAWLRRDTDPSLRSDMPTMRPHGENGATVTARIEPAPDGSAEQAAETEDSTATTPRPDLAVSASPEPRSRGRGPIVLGSIVVCAAVGLSIGVFVFALVGEQPTATAPAPTTAPAPATQPPRPSPTAVIVAATSVSGAPSTAIVVSTAVPIPPTGVPLTAVAAAPAAAPTTAPPTAAPDPAATVTPLPFLRPNTPITIAGVATLLPSIIRPAQAPTVGSRLEVIIPNSSLRREPRLNATLVQILQAGDMLTMEQESEGDVVAGERTWYRVSGSLSRGPNPVNVDGFVHSSLVRVAR
jgi:protein phosphatase